MLFPPHLVADEKHSWWLQERVYIATTAAGGCLLGVGVSETADTVGLTQAYGEFQQEILALNPEYAPETVNTDGWESTQNAWQVIPWRDTDVMFSPYCFEFPQLLSAQWSIFQGYYSQALRSLSQSNARVFWTKTAPITRMGYRAKHPRSASTKTAKIRGEVPSI